MENNANNKIELNNIRGKVYKLKYKKQPPLNDDDVLKLFLGLVKLVKKNAEYDANIKAKSQIDVYAKEVKRLIEINNQQKNLIDKLSNFEKKATV